jgi:hypothetical protein
MMGENLRRQLSSKVPVWFDRKFDFTFPAEQYPNFCVRLWGAPARLASLPFHTIDPAYLSVSVSYTPKDFENFKRAFECHRSQYTSETFKALEKAMDEGWHGTVSFREWNSTRSASDLFH